MNLYAFNKLYSGCDMAKKNKIERRSNANKQVKEKKTVAEHTLIRNKFMETQRRNALVNELNRIENELGRGALPYHDKTVLESRKDELIKEIKKSVL